MGRKHEYSLAAKLAAMDIGDSLFFEDSFGDAKVTSMERQIADRVAKSPRLAGRRFSTGRGRVVFTGQDKLALVLKVTRKA